MKTHESLSSTLTPELGSNRNFGLVFTGVFTIISLLPLIHHQTPRWWAAGLAVTFLLVSLIAPSGLAPLNKLWHRFGLLLGNIIAPLMMGALFLLTITPIGAVMRLTGKDPLSRRFNPQAQTYWVPKETPTSWTDSLKNQF